MNKSASAICAFVLVSTLTTGTFAQDLPSLLKRMKDSAIQPEQATTKKEIAPKIEAEKATPATTSSQIGRVFTGKDLSAIPRSDQDREDEYANFNKNWKNKRLSFLGKVNRSGGVSIDEYYIQGCTVALKGVGIGTTVVATGNLKTRSSGGSGGEPIEITGCSVEVKQNAATSAQTTDIKLEEQMAPKEIKLGYLKGSIKVAETYGCIYALKSDDKKKREANQVGNDSADDSGVVINVDGRDVLVKGKYDAKRVFSGTFDGYRFTIPKAMNYFEISKSPSYKLQVPVVGQCSG